MQPGPGFAVLSRGNLRLLLNRPGAGGAGRATPDGRLPAPGGWNRIQIEVSDLESEVEALREAGASFRNDIVMGQGGSQTLLDDPSGNPIGALPARRRLSSGLLTRTLNGAHTMSSAPNLATNVLLRSEETDGHVSVTEIVVPPHSAGPPLHTHDFDEAFCVLQGELVFQVHDALVIKGAGDLSFAARNVAHTLANHSDAPARYLLVCTPAGFERTGRDWPPTRPEPSRRSGRCGRSPRSRSSARRSRRRGEAAGSACTRCCALPWVGQAAAATGT